MLAPVPNRIASDRSSIVCLLMGLRSPSFAVVFPSIGLRWPSFARVSALSKPSEGFRSVCLAKWFFGGLVRHGQFTTQFQDFFVFVWPCRRRRQDQTTVISLNMCAFLALVPQASKTHLANKATSGSLLVSAPSKPDSIRSIFDRLPLDPSSIAHVLRSFALRSVFDRPRLPAFRPL